MSAHDPHTACGADIAAYALHALEPDEAKRFERHLDDCILCRTDLESLRPTVDALPYAAEPVQPPASLRRSIMAVVEADAKRRIAAEQATSPSLLERLFGARPLLPAMAAACVLLVAGIGVGLGLTGGGGEDARTVDGQVLAKGADDASASLEVRESGGKLVVDRLPQSPVGRVYQVWLRTGRSVPKPTDALFTVNRDGRGSVAVPGDLENVDEVLVTHEPRGGSTAPTSAPNIRVSF